VLQRPRSPVSPTPRRSGYLAGSFRVDNPALTVEGRNSGACGSQAWPPRQRGRPWHGPRSCQPTSLIIREPQPSTSTSYLSRCCSGGGRGGSSRCRRTQGSLREHRPRSRPSAQPGALYPWHTFYYRGPLPQIPPSVHQLHIRKRQGGEGVRLWIDDLDGLLGLVDMDAVGLHLWNATVEDIEHADRVVLDVDPARASNGLRLSRQACGCVSSSRRRAYELAEIDGRQ